MATYHDLVPGFRALLAQNSGLPEFYASVRRLAALTKDERHRQLGELGGQPMLAESETAQERVAR